MRWSIVIATIIALVLKILLLSQAAGPTLASYEHLTYAQHISETGLPLLHDEMTWQAADYDYAPLYHYLVAFLGIFIPLPLAGLAIANIAGLFIPYLIYKLTQHLSTHQYAADITALASSAAPILYQYTTFDATPFALAVPLLLLTLHAFISTIRTPQKQTLLLISATALALTSPISLVLAIGLLISLIIRKIQHETLPRKATEATLFITFLSLWAAMLLYNDTIQAYGIQTFWIVEYLIPDIPTAVTSIGVLTVIAGSYSVYDYLADKHHPHAYPILGVTTATVLALLTGILPVHQALTLLSLVLLPLAARVINMYTQSRHRSRIPVAYHVGTVLFALVLIFTHLLPAVTHGTERLSETVTQEQLELVQTMQPSDDLYLWTQNTGFLLQFYGHRSAITDNVYANAESTKTIERLQEIDAGISPIQYIEILAENDIDAVITTRGAIDYDRCFSTLYSTQHYEVNRRECVIESRTA